MMAGAPLSSRNELSSFLAGIERRAFKQAMFAIRNEETALEITASKPAQVLLFDLN